MVKRTRQTSPDSSGTSRYRAGLRAPIRGLWLGVFDHDQFHREMSRAIKRFLQLAWYAGAAECGIKPDELTADEVLALQDAIDYEYLWIGRFGTEIAQKSKANGGLLTPLYNRAEIWLGRWEGVKAQAMTMACGDRKLEWVLGPAEHCKSCLKLAGKVKRASYWHEKGILPRVHDAPYLECHGFRCACDLVPTDKPISRGPLPRLP